MKAFFKNLWEKIKAACFDSLTMAWSYLVTVAGVLFTNLNEIALLLNDPDLTAQIQKVFGADATTVGKWLLIVGIITTAARLKSIIWKG